MGEWRPIETAPKDGSWVDLWAYFPEHDLAKRVPSAKWDREVNNWRYSYWHFGQYKYPPTITHWQPIPAPPGEDQ